MCFFDILFSTDNITPQGEQLQFIVWDRLLVNMKTKPGPDVENLCLLCHHYKHCFDDCAAKYSCWFHKSIGERACHINYETKIQLPLWELFSCMSEEILRDSPD